MPVHRTVLFPNNATFSTSLFVSHATSATSSGYEVVYKLELVYLPVLLFRI